jgi:predicted porin
MKLMITLPFLIGLLPASASALEIYNQGGNSLKLGGELAIAEIYAEDRNNVDGGFSTIDNLSFLNFDFSHQFNDLWKAGAFIEWGFNAVSTGASSTGDAFIYNRIAKFYFNSPMYGEIGIGKQNSPYHDLAEWTDTFWINGGSASGIYDGRNDPAADGGEAGTGRANDAITYRYNFMGAEIGLQYQGDQGRSDGDRTSAYQVAVEYDSMSLFDIGFSVGASYNHANYKGQPDSQAWLFGLQYEDPILYAAATYGKYEHFSTINGNITNPIGVARDAYGYEIALGYTIQDYQLYGGYNHLKDKNSAAKYAYFVLGASWTYETLIFALEVNLDNKNVSEMGQNNGQNTYGIAMQYNF